MNGDIVLSPLSGFRVGAQGFGLGDAWIPSVFLASNRLRFPLESSGRRTRCTN